MAVFHYSVSKLANTASLVCCWLNTQDFPLCTSGKVWFYQEELSDKNEREQTHKIKVEWQLPEVGDWRLWEEVGHFFAINILTGHGGSYL